MTLQSRTKAVHITNNAVINVFASAAKASRENEFYRLVKQRDRAGRGVQQDRVGQDRDGN